MDDLRAARITERDLQSNVLDLVELRGLWAYHTYDSRRSQPGWPDLVILGPNGALFRELKTMSGTLTKAQRYVLAQLSAAGLNADVWRPCHWLDYTIDRELREIS